MALNTSLGDLINFGNHAKNIIAGFTEKVVMSLRSQGMQYSSFVDEPGRRQLDITRAKAELGMASILPAGVRK